jgi:hypothetical protein
VVSETGDVNADLPTRLVESWKALCLTDRPPATEAALERFATMYGASLPSTMRAYLRLADGMDADGREMQDDRMIRFWPIAEIGPAARDGELQACFEFADYLLDSHRYGVFLSGPRRGQVVLTGGGEPVPVADDLGQFIDRYLNAPVALFPPREAVADEPEE